jgi:hypothetical protein
MSTNPMSKPINQKRGPQVGNAGMGTKRADFMAEKNKRSSDKATLAEMVTNALEMRGRDNRSSRSAGVEPVKANVNVGRGPTKGNAGKSAAGRRGALGATSGY